MKALAYERAHPLDAFAVDLVEVDEPRLRDGDLLVEIRAVVRRRLARLAVVEEIGEPVRERIDIRRCGIRVAMDPRSCGGGTVGHISTLPIRKMDNLSYP